MTCSARLMAIAGWVLILLSPTSVSASDAGFLGLPIACHLREDCWVAQYADHGPGKAVADFACGNRTYDVHNGTDFAIQDRGAMISGVPVVAATAGTVVRFRDNMPDSGLTPANRSTIANRECGNAVVIEHVDGWETQYCHLQRGSIIVRPGDRVAEGQKLGLVGLSGMTQFPHVHLTVRRGGTVIDPFIGLARDGSCGPGKHPLWKSNVIDALAYDPFTIYHTGFADREVKPDEVRGGAVNSSTLSRSAPFLVLWADAFGVAKDDVIDMRVIGPDGSIVVQSQQKIRRDQARYFRLIGQRLKSDAWPPGKYRGEITLQRVGPSGKTLKQTVEPEVVLQ